MLAATAGQIVAATALDLTIKEIVVGETPFAVGRVAKDIILDHPAADWRTAIVAMAGTVGFAQAAGVAMAEVRAGCEGKALAAIDDAAALLQLWIEDGRLARLVQALDAYEFGERRVLQ